MIRPRPFDHAAARAWRFAWRRGSGLALLGVCQAASLAPALAADPAQIGEGIRVFRGAGQCETCHVWSGTGGPANDVSAVYDVPPLVRSTLDRAQMIELVSCGTPGGYMPQYLATAWTDRRRCYGKLAAELAAEERPPRPYTVLTQVQIEAVVAFVQEVYQGKGMTLDYCLKYHGEKSRSCELYR